MRIPSGLNAKQSLLLGTSIVGLLFGGQAVAQQGNGNETVIVTGTRVQGMTAADSAAPITVLGSDALTQSSGSMDLRQSLGQTVPSFTSQAFSGDLGNLTRAANLRGLSPNDTLVLIDGHRRHQTAGFQTGAGSFGGNSAPDLSMIPTAAIDHVEVLLEGAAAQYGTDAIAGVVNLILKKRSSGGLAMVTGGRRYSTEGEQYDYSFNLGLPLFDKGYANITFEKQASTFVQLGGPDSRFYGPDNTTAAQEGLIGMPAILAQPAGTFSASTLAGFQAQANAGIVPCANGVCVPLSTRQATVHYPRSNQENSSPEINQTTVSYNAGYDFSDALSIYSYGTWGHRYGIGKQNYRLPNQNIAAPGSSQPCSATNPQGYATASSTSNGLTPACAIGVSNLGFPGTGSFALAGSAPGTPGINANHQIIASGQAGTLYTPGELVEYPLGFEPEEAVKDTDYQYDLGIKADIAEWNVDAAISYGKDINDIYTLNSGNRSLFIDTHTTPTNFFDGTFSASEFLGTVDVTRKFDVGMASPLNFAFGFEAREDMFEIRPGDAGSQYKEGAQSFPGFNNAVAGAHSRKNYSGYIDLELAPIESVDIDIAGRAEHYSDFGDTQIGKITARWDITPQIAIRGTLSTGFRAPNLQEEWYNTVNVSPTSAVAQLPADSAAAKLLGVGDLKPEISTSYSAGIVAHPLNDLSVTLDAYSITLGDRISGSSTVYLRGASPLAPVCGDAFTALGLQPDPTAARVGCSVFVNSFGTLTQGVDFTANYPTDFGEMGLIDWTLAANYNNTSISRLAPIPPQLAGATFLTPSTAYSYEHPAPAIKAGLTANWSLDELGFTFRETVYSTGKSVTSTAGAAIPCGTSVRAGVVLQAIDANGCWINNSQPSVGITDVEARYNITDALQLAIGGNNVFNIHAKANCNFAVTSNGGTTVCNNGGVVNSAPVGTAFDPYGGYYYGRVAYKW